MTTQGDDDLEKLKFYLDAKFEFNNSVLFSSLVKKPSNEELDNLINTLGKYETERLYNHFHMSAITENLARQREYSIELWKEWRAFFSEEMPEKQIVIEIYDQGLEVIFYVYEVCQ